MELWPEDVLKLLVAILNPERCGELDALFPASGLKVNSRKWAKAGDEMIGTWQAHGSPQSHDVLAQRLLGHNGVKGFRV